jgi:hypothetical protein
MAGFRSLASQVRDPRLVGAQQRSSLRRCLERFAPYGHRATWHHLCARAGFGTADRWPAHDRLIAALDELEEARAVWLVHEDEFAARRKREKHHGIRQPTALDNWHRRTWGGCGIAWCDDPLVHPTDRLADVLRRLISALRAEPGSTCPVCQDLRIIWSTDLRCVPQAGAVCVNCGIVVPQPVLTPQALEVAKAARLALR